MADELPDVPETFTRLDGVHVLIVDDDDDARKICEAMLRYAGATVRVVGSALAAVRTLRHVRPDVVLTDLSMPRNDGLWLVDWIRGREDRRRDHLPVVAITARDDLYDDTSALRHGLDAYLRKPVPFRTLCSTIAEVAGPATNDGRSAASA
jgi:CheY-like chemotaxis protein